MAYNTTTSGGGGGGCCRCCTSFIFTSGLTALFMWLSLRTSNPTCSIQDIYIPALNTSSNYTNNHTIYFDLKLENGMNDKGVHYANINLTFFYNFTLPVANYAVPAFYQGRKKKARRKKVVEAAALPWEVAREAVGNGSTVGFRVGLATRVRFKILFWYTKRHSFVRGGEFAVDGSGRKVGKRGIRLKSGATDLRTCSELQNMADAIVTALLQTVVGNLNSVSIQEIGLACGLENSLNNLKSQFETIQLVLQDAEMKQRKSLTLQNWLRNLKNAAYDAEDVLDQIANVRLRLRADFQRGNHHKLKAFLSPRNPLLFRLKIARKVRNVTERLNVIMDEESKLGLSVGGVMENQNGDVLALADRQTSSLVNESEIYGRDEEKKRVVEKLVDNNKPDLDDLYVYAICGMGGIGKTTLAQLVYNDERVEGHFELRIWVCVSVDFSIHRLVRAIISSVEKNECNILELDPLMSRLQEMLRGRRFLLVLDDVWNENDRQWDELKEALRCGSKGSALLVTTRIEKVALMMATVDIHHLRYLSEDESWSLFKKRAFATGEGDGNLEEIGKKIVRKCGGVPLAVKALGSLMRYKTSEREWSAIKESEIWHLSDDGNGILPALRLSYDNLLPQMRQCFAYCCIFPKDELVEEDQLVQLWMANGLVHSEGQIDLPLAGQLIFKELVWRSFFQEVQKNYQGNMTCKMHDLMHDLAESVMRFETCSMQKPGDELKIPKTLRHLSIGYPVFQEYWANKVKLKLPIGGSLRSLILHGIAPKHFSSFISRQQYLRVLDLDYRSIEKLSIIFCKMEHLRYLALGCLFLKRLPESLTCLHNLQTLKLTGSGHLLELPKSMKYMKNLYFLDVESWPALVCTPPGLGELTCLQKLSIFIVGLDPAHGIGQLKDLTLGGNLCIEGLGCIRDFEDAKSANLVAKRNLTNLSLSWKKGIKQESAEHYEEILEGLQPYQNLEKIFISCYQGLKFPTWMSTLSFNNLSEIRLEKCNRCEHLPPLGKLPSLTSLQLLHMDSIKRLDGKWHGSGESSSFPALKILNICEMPNLEEWTIPDTIESFLCLEVLIIDNCPKLTELPFLPTLRSLSLSDENTELLKSVMFVTSLTSLSLYRFSEFDILPEGDLLQNHKAECVQPLISNLIKLVICSSSGLCPLPNWLGSLQSLSELEIWYCVNLKSLPDDFRNLKSLRKLTIYDCPLLAERCQKPEGEEWLKISHIPQIYIDCKNIQD